jgi:hypothetical protein
MSETSTKDIIIKVAAVGSLMVSSGGYLYLNNKIEDGINRLEAVEQKIMIQTGKLSQQDDTLKISSLKLKDMEEIANELSKIKESFSELSLELNDEFEKIHKKMDKQETSVKLLSDKVKIICKTLDLSVQDLQESKPVKNQLPLKKKNVPIPEKKPKPVLEKKKEKESEEVYKRPIVNDRDIMDQMGMILGGT